MSDDRKMTTGEFSILNLYGNEEDPETTGAFYEDLNLIQIIDKLVSKWGRNIRKYFRYLPATEAEEAYRRAVYCDIRKDTVFNIFSKYIEKLSEIDELRWEKEKVGSPMQKAVWFLREAEAYCNAYEWLENELRQATPDSEGMKRFLGILKNILDSDEHTKMRDQTSTILKKLRGLRFIITYEKDRMSVVQGELPGAGAYEEWLESMDNQETRTLQNPFIADPSLTELETACLEILRKKDPDLFKKVKETAEVFEDYKNPVLARFEQEILFYLSYCSLQKDMEKEGFAFATPVPSKDERMEARGLYDLALALTNLYSGKKVVPNDFYYGAGERFFVLTGPNQGGKTTFARSLGQLVYFSRMGLDVPADSAVVPFFPDIQTHFSVEESVETGRGKLKEELIRLSPMMEENRKGTFVIINELFTTAANYDAVIMGKKVLEHFIGLGCMGIYVTHLKELAENREGVVSMRAMLNDRRMQTFEIRRAEANDTACAENQVNKYRLTYEQLKERL